MAAVSPYWAALVGRWDEVEQSMLAEAGIDWEKASSAPKTYALMDVILRPVEDPNIVVIRPEDATRALAAIKRRRKGARP